MNTDTTRTMEFRRDLTSSPQRVWDIVAAVEGVDKWVPVIKSCRVDGTGPGARRHCEMVDGTKILEVVTAIDHETRTFRYRADEGLPVRSYEGVLHVRDGRGVKPEAVWTVTVQGEPASIAAVAGMLDQVAPMLFDGLEALARKGA